MASLGNLVIELSANVARLQSDLGKAQNVAERYAKNISSVFGAAIGGLGIAGIGAFINKTIEAADRLNDLRTRTGLTGQQLLVLEGAAVRSGAGIEAVGDVTSKLARRLAEASKGTGDAAAAYQAMGINVHRASGELKSVDEILREVGAKFRGYEDGANKAALATAALGKGGDRLIPVVEAIEETEKRFQRLGITIDEDVITRADQFKDTMEDVASVSGVLGRQLVSELLPTMQKIAEAFTEINKESSIFQTIGRGVEIVFETLTILGDNFVFTFSVIAKELAGFAAQISAFGRGDFAGIQEINKQVAEDTAKLRAELDKREKLILSRREGPDNFERMGDLSRLGRGKAPGVPDLNLVKAGQDALRKLEDQQAKLRLDALTDAAKRETALLESQRQDNLVSERDYWARRVEIQKTAVEAEIRELTVQAERQQKLVDQEAKKGKTSKDYYNAVGDLDKTLAARNKLELDFANTVALTYAEAQRSAKAYERQVEDLNVQLLEFQGNTAEAASRRFAAATTDQREQALRNGRRDVVELIDNLGAATVAQAEFNQERQKQEDVIARLGISEERIQNSMRTGAISELEALQRTGNARKEAAAQIETMVSGLERIAAASNNPALVLQAEQARAALERLRSETDLLAQKFDTVFTDAFSDAFTDFVMGTKTASEAFKSFANTVISELVRIQAKSLATELSKGFGIGDLLSGIFGRSNGLSAIGAATGIGASDFLGSSGIMGPYDVGTDYVPRTGLALVHQGEQIIPAGQSRGQVFIDARGADPAALARVEQALVRLNYSIEPRAVNAVSSARRRGM